MSPIMVVCLSGVLFGGGIYLAVTGLFPAQPPLQEALGRLGQPQPTPPPSTTGSPDSIDVRVGRIARRLAVVEKLLVPMRADLRIMHRTGDEQAALLATYAFLGFAFAPVVALGGRLVGLPIPWIIPMWLSLGGAALAVLLAVKEVKPAAQKRRRAFSHALSAFCDVCGMSLAAGRGVESSIEAAAHAGTGWPFVEIQSALRAGYVRGETPWDALARLGREADLTDLTEFAAAISLAGEGGAAIKELVGSKARTVRERLTSDVERTAASTTERMGIPATFLLLGFIIFLGFPGIAVLFR
jgi:tight adherence protein C